MAASSMARPVVVRVKRKQFQEPLDAFWLEINERPLKRPFLEFARLSISDSAGNDIVDEAQSKKVFVQRIETVSSANFTKDVLESFLCHSGDMGTFRKKIEERKHMHKRDNGKKDHLRSAAVQDRQNSSRNARFKQIWKSRMADGMQNENDLHEIYHVYDVVRTDPESKSHCEVKEPKNSNSDSTELSKFLPLLKEYLPAAATELESDLEQDNFVYDIYTVENDIDRRDEGSSSEYPLIQVDDDADYYDGPCESEYDSEDSNAENGDLHDYPDEESSEDDERSDVDERSSEEDDCDDDASGDSYDGEFMGMTEEEIMDLRMRYC